MFSKPIKGEATDQEKMDKSQAIINTAREDVKLSAQKLIKWYEEKKGQS